MIPRMLGSQALWSLAGYLVTLIVGVPLQLYLARSIGAEGLGAFSLIEATVAIMAALLSFGLASSILKYLPELLEKDRLSLVKRFCRQDLLKLGLCGIAVVVLVALFYSWLPVSRIDFDLGYFWVVLAATLVPISLLSQYVQQVLRALLAVRYVVLATSVIQLLGKAVLLVVFLHWGMGLDGLVLAVVLSALFALLYMARMARQLLRRQETVTEVVDAPINATMDVPNDVTNDVQVYEAEFSQRRSAFARNQYLSGLLGLVSPFIDRFLLGAFSGIHAVGIFGTTRLLAAMPGVFLQLLVAGAAPMFSRFQARNEFDNALNLYHLANDWCVRLSFPLFAFLFIHADKVLAYFGADFAELGALPLRMLVASLFLNSLTGPLGMFVNMWGGERILLKLGVVNEILLVAGYVVLIPRFGLEGAAGTHLASMVYLTVSGYLAARYQIGIHWFDRRYLRWLLPMAFFVALSVLFDISFASEATFPVLIAFFLLATLGFHGLFILQGLHEDEVQLIAELKQSFMDKLG